MKKIFVFLPLLWAACSPMEASFGANDIPLRPADGYLRSDYLSSPYYTFFESPGEFFPPLLNKRALWTAKNQDFTSAYPSFNIGFSYFQNSGDNAKFSFAERLFFSDVFDLIRYAVNSEVFAAEILQRTFYENDGSTEKSAPNILAEIRAISFATSLAKRPLGDEVLAEASVGGFLNIIWVRDDVDYSRSKVNEMAIVILHEITHNLGYSHPSLVNYGVHRPTQEAIRLSTKGQVENFIAHTPYHEGLMLNRVRSLSKARSLGAPYTTVSCSTGDIFP